MVPNMAERSKTRVTAVPIVAHGLLRRLAPMMLIVYRRRDAREIA
jgi:hypothetical protein